MKSKLFLLFITVSVLSVCRAQKINFGVTTNINLTLMDGKGMSSSSQAGYNGGAFAKISVGKNWSLQPEVLYTLQHLKKSSDFSVYYVNSGRSISNTDIHAHFISLPLLVNYRINQIITVHAGPEYNILTYDNEDLLKNNQPAFKKYSSGVVAGAELSLAPSFSFFANYYRNLTNINNIDNRYKWHYSQLRFGINVRVF